MQVKARRKGPARPVILAAQAHDRAAEAIYSLRAIWRRGRSFRNSLPSPPTSQPNPHPTPPSHSPRHTPSDGVFVSEIRDGAAGGGEVGEVRATARLRGPLPATALTSATCRGGRPRCFVASVRADGALGPRREAAGRGPGG